MIEIVDAAYKNFRVISFVLESDCVIMGENNLLSRLVMEKNNWRRIKSILVMVLAFVSQDKITFSMIPACKLFSDRI